MYRAVLDTCVLVPGLQCDFLLQLAAERAYAPLWGSGVLFELDYVLAGIDEKRARTGSEERRAQLFREMARAFPGALIQAPKTRDYSYDLHDVGDGHVAHAAIMGKADAIVTDDTRAGFRTSRVLAAADIEIAYPHEFAANCVVAHPEAGIRAVEKMSARRANPPESEVEVLRKLSVLCRMSEVELLLLPYFVRPDE